MPLEGHEYSIYINSIQKPGGSGAATLERSLTLFSTIPTHALVEKDVWCWLQFLFKLSGGAN